MTHVITRSCCNDAACVPACPVDCIHPAPGEPGFATAEMLYINPDSCIDCGACVDVCPVSAIAPDYELTATTEIFEGLNAAWYAGSEPVGTTPRPAEVRPRVEPETAIRVAVVGAGAAGHYVVDELLKTPGLRCEISLIEQQLTPGGLVRHGVAPDHLDTKRVADAMTKAMRRKGVRVHLGLALGRDVTLEELRATHHAVVLTTGPSADRQLGIPGEQLDGVRSAAELVGWYNGHPEQAESVFDLSHERAVVIGNGNVALDVARILLADVDQLRRSDIAPHALEALSQSNVREVVVVGRRGPAAAAFTAGEMLALGQSGCGATVDADDLAADALRRTGTASVIAAFKADAIAGWAGHAPAADGRRLTMRFWLSPTRLVGTTRLEAVELRRTGLPDPELPDSGSHEPVRIECGLVLRAIGYTVPSVPGLPGLSEDPSERHVAGRLVASTGSELPGVYLAGWVKRGAQGGIGANKWDARETVQSLLADLAAGVLPEPASPWEPPAAAATLQAWLDIDALERSRGRAEGRPRIKLTPSEQVEVAESSRSAAAT